MKKAFSLFWVVLFCVQYNANAQMSVSFQSHEKYKTLGSANYIITYEAKAISNTSSRKVNNDIQILEIGDNVSKTYSKYMYDNDSLCTELIRKGVQNVPLLQRFVSREDIYKNYPKGKMTVSYRTFMNGPVLKYEEPMPTFKWKLLLNFKTLLNHQCQKAVCIFRGRRYTAWFTSEVPIFGGPWKFDGLPGLILQISDEKKEFEYNCIGFHKVKGSHPIKYWKWFYRNTTREKSLPFIKSMHEKPNAFINEVVGSKIVIMSGEDPNLLRYPYNPKELE